MKVRITIEYDPDWDMSEGVVEPQEEIKMALDHERHEWLEDHVGLADFFDYPQPDQPVVAEGTKILFEVLDDSGNVIATL